MTRVLLGSIFSALVAATALLAVRRKTIPTAYKTFSRSADPVAYWAFVVIGLITALFALAWSLGWFGLGALTPGPDL